MSEIHYRLFEGDTRSNIVVLGPDRLLQADSFHPHWAAIVEGIRAGDESAFGLFDVKTGAARRLQNLSDRVQYNGEDILFDGDVINSVLSEQIKRAVESGEADYEPLIKFWEKLESNPSEHSKSQAYNWLATHDFKITPEGDVVAYKGVEVLGMGGFSSISASRENDVPSAYVDGIPVPPRSTVPQNIGSVVTMPRAEVKHDPNVHCHRGLHVGDWSYAHSFARGAVLEVHVNPRDIVSVPNDENARKVRTSRYKVVSVVEAEFTGGPVLRPAAVAETWSDVGYAPV